MDRLTVPIDPLHLSAQLSPHSRALPLYAIAADNVHSLRSSGLTIDPDPGIPGNRREVPRFGRQFLQVESV